MAHRTARGAEATLTRISSRQHPLVREFRSLASAPDPCQARLLLDGVHLVREALAARLHFDAVVIADTALERKDEAAHLATSLSAAGVPVYAATPGVVAAVSPVRTASGVVAIARRDPATVNAVTSADGVVVVLVDVQDPGNVGAIVRSAEAAGAAGVLVAGASAHPYSWKAVRGSMGSLLRLPVATVADAGLAMAEVRRSGLRSIAAVPRGGTPPRGIDWSGRVALWLGGEGAGLDASTVNACDDRVTIPMRSPVESLGVAAAAAMLLYEYARRT